MYRSERKVVKGRDTTDLLVKDFVESVRNLRNLKTGGDLQYDECGSDQREEQHLHPRHVDRFHHLAIDPFQADDEVRPLG